MFNYKGKIRIVNRLNNSINGNPRFLIDLVDAEQFIILTSKSDYPYNYNIENLANKNCDCVVRYYYTKSGNGRIENIKEIK